MAELTSRWTRMSRRTRGLVLAVGAADAALRGWALVDLHGRPAEDVNGSRRGWAIALLVVSSAGALPLAYLLRGRRRSGA